MAGRVQALPTPPMPPPTRLHLATPFRLGANKRHLIPCITIIMEAAAPPPADAALRSPRPARGMAGPAPANQADLPLALGVAVAVLGGGAAGLAAWLARGRRAKLQHMAVQTDRDGVVVAATVPALWANEIQLEVEVQPTLFQVCSPDGQPSASIACPHLM